MNFKFKVGDKLRNVRPDTAVIHVVGIENEFYMLKWWSDDSGWVEHSYHYRDIESLCCLLKTGVDYMLELLP